MLDLDRLRNKTAEIRLNGRALHVLAPSVALVRQLLALGGCPDDELLGRQAALAAALLSRNAEGLCVTEEETSALPPSALQAVLRQAMETAVEAEQDPN